MQFFTVTSHLEVRRRTTPRRLVEYLQALDLDEIHEHWDVFEASLARVMVRSGPRKSAASRVSIN